MFLYLSLANLIQIIFSYIIMDYKHIRSKKKLFPLLLVIVISSTIAINYTFMSEFFLFIFLILLNINEKEESVLFSTMLFIISSFLLVFISSFFTTSINMTILLMTDEKMRLLSFLGFEVLTYFFLFLMSLAISKWLVPTLISNPYKNVFFIGLLGLYVVGQFNSIYRYITDFSISLVIMLSFIILAIMVYYIFQSTLERYQLRLTIERQEIEAKYLNLYANEIKKQDSELRKFKHDYINILASLDYFIQLNDMEKLEDYYNKHIQPTKSFFNENNHLLSPLTSLHNDALKSIIALKLLNAYEKEINVTIEIPDTIHKDNAMNDLILVRMLGIILDNSLEALEEFSDGLLRIGIFNQQDHYLFIVENTICSPTEPLHLLKKEGFSTKGTNRGLGLSNLEELASNQTNLMLETIVTEQHFTQKIYIKKGDN